MYDNTNKMRIVSRNQSEPFQSTPPAFFSLKEGRVTPSDMSKVKGPPLIIQGGGTNMGKGLEDNLSAVDEGVRLNLNSANVSSNRTPIVDMQGKTKLILPDSSIYRQASDLHGKLQQHCHVFHSRYGRYPRR